MKLSDRRDLHALLSATVDGTLTEEKTTELAGLLRSDEEVRRFYIRYLDMTAALSDAGPLPAVADRPRGLWAAVGASVAALSLLAAVLLLWVGAGGGPGGGLRNGGGGPVSLVTDAAEATRSLGYVATIVAVSDNTLLNDRPVSTGTRMLPGPCVLRAGTVTVQFDGGARVFFDGPAAFTLRSRRTMAVHRGTFVFRGDQFSESIEIVTPHSVFKNIGTRYAAVVDADGEELHVAEGAVRRTSGPTARSGTEEWIAAGAGMRFGAGNGVRESIPIDAALVARPLETASPEVRDDVPVVVDDFRGEEHEIAKLQSGSGWSETWRSRRGAMRIVRPGLAGPGSVAVRHDGSGKPPGERRSAAHRQFKKPLDLSQDGIHYLRFFVRRGPQPGNDEHRATVVLRARGLSTEEELEQGALIQIMLRKDDAAMVRVADALTRVSFPQSPGETYAVVAKIVSGRTNPEQVLVRLMSADRLADSEEPTEWSVVSESVSTDMVVDQLSLECVSATWIEFGDICIGSTWDSVTKPVRER